MSRRTWIVIEVLTVVALLFVAFWMGDWVGTNQLPLPAVGGP